FRVTQYVCDRCLRLDVTVTRLAEADRRAVTFTDGQRDESLSYRAAQLNQAFAAAESLGLLVMPMETGRVLTTADLAQVLPDDAVSAGRRFVSWMHAVAPVAAAEREAVLRGIDGVVAERDSGPDESAAV